MSVQDEMLDNLLDNLDDLYDKTCTPWNTHALVLATAVALAGTTWEPLLAQTAEALKVRTGDSDRQYAHALDVTHELRLALAADFAKRSGPVQQ